MADKKQAKKKKTSKKKVTKKRVAKKKATKKKRKVGRPKFEINYEEVEQLAGIQCTQEEIAAFLGCSVDTLQRDAQFCGIYKAAMNKGRMSLRRKQWKALEGGNNTMLVWLGKQYLGQKDKNEHTGADDTPLMPPQLVFVPHGG